jgi:hypothetical protein
MIIDLANDLIKGMPVEQEIMDWQHRHDVRVLRRLKNARQRATWVSDGTKAFGNEIQTLFLTRFEVFLIVVVIEEALVYCISFPL